MCVSLIWAMQQNPIVCGQHWVIQVHRCPVTLYKYTLYSINLKEEEDKKIKPLPLGVYNSISFASSSRLCVWKERQKIKYPRVVKREPTCIIIRGEKKKRHGDLIWNDEMTLASIHALWEKNITSLQGENWIFRSTRFILNDSDARAKGPHTLYAISLHHFSSLYKYRDTA